MPKIPEGICRFYSFKPVGVSINIVISYVFSEVKTHEILGQNIAHISKW
jgi:hypothetical protein